MTLTINRICDLRDKFYAHLDKEYEAYIGAISVQDILKCFVTIEQIIITLSSQEVLQKYLDDIPSKNDLKL